MKPKCIVSYCFAFHVVVYNLVRLMETVLGSTVNNMRLARCDVLQNIEELIFRMCMSNKRLFPR